MAKTSRRNSQNVPTVDPYNRDGDFLEAHRMGTGNLLHFHKEMTGLGLHLHKETAHIPDIDDRRRKRR